MLGVPLWSYQSIFRIGGTLFRDWQDPGRWFELRSSSEADTESIYYSLSPDTHFSFGGWFTERGLNYEIASLELGISWHDQNLEKAFEFYKHWIIDRMDKSEVEQKLKEQSYEVVL